MPALENLGYFSVDEKASPLVSPWARKTRVAAQLSADGSAEIWLRLFNQMTQTYGVYTFSATKVSDVPVQTPDWPTPFLGWTFAINYPVPPSIPSLVFISSEVDSNFHYYLIAFSSAGLTFQHATPAVRGPRLLLAHPRTFRGEGSEPLGYSYGQPGGPDSGPPTIGNEGSKPREDSYGQPARPDSFASG